MLENSRRTKEASNEQMVDKLRIGTCEPKPGRFREFKVGKPKNNVTRVDDRHGRCGRNTWQRRLRAAKWSSARRLRLLALTRFERLHMS